MILDDGMHEEADERVDALWPDWMNEDQRWEAFREILEGEPVRQRENAVHHLVLVEMLSRLYPDLHSDAWRKFGWNDVLSGKLSAAAFTHKLRLAQTTGSRSGKL